MVAFICLSFSTAYADFEPRPIQNLTFKKFPKNFAVTTTHLISKNNILPFVIGTGAIVASTQWDTNVKDYFSKEFRFSTAANIASDAGNGYAMIPVTLALFAFGLHSHNEKFHRMSYALTEAMLLNTIITETVKATSDRERPNGRNDLSFPSGHTSTAFVFATIIQRYYGWKVGIPAYIGASFIGVSRLEKNVHFLSDVVAGASFGYLIGRTASRDAHKLQRVAFVPQITRHGYGINLVIR